jgi:hypothetical protein
MRASGLTRWHAWRKRSGGFVLPQVVTDASTSANDRIAFAIFAASALLLGSFIRLLVVSQSDFPIGDGGLFFQMVRDLQGNNFQEPLYTRYNHAHIPFAYPPLGIYTAAIVHKVTGIGLLPLFRFLPLTSACLSIIAFALLARAILPMVAAISATFIFALLPDSFDPEIKGGGLTRAPGQLLAILAVWQLYTLYTKPSRRSMFLSVLLSALAVVSHPEWGQFVLFSAALMLGLYGRNRGALRRSAIVTASVALASSPWWLVVMIRYGFGVLLSPIVGNEQVFPMQNSLRTVITLNLTHESWLPIGTVLALIGVVVCLRSNLYLLPAWLVLVLVTDSRGWQIPLVVPLSLLAGVGTQAFLSAWRKSEHPAYSPSHRVNAELPTWSLGVILTFLIIRSIGSAVVYEEANNTAVSGGERVAMAWISHHSSPNARFLAVGTRAGSSEEDVEWFPALTGRTSVETLQGQEWIPGSYARQSLQIQALQGCLPDLECIRHTLQAAAVRADYMYVAKSSPNTPCEGLCGELNHSRLYSRVYSGLGAWIYRAMP